MTLSNEIKIGKFPFTANSRASIVGQHEAIVTISRAVRRARAGLKDPRRPIGSFIFLGPTGVGKTALALVLAERLGAEIVNAEADMLRVTIQHTPADDPRLSFENGVRLVQGLQRLLAAAVWGNLAPAGKYDKPQGLLGEAITNEFAEVRCQEYFLTPDSALFGGGVRIEHPQMKWTCNEITMLTPPELGKTGLGDEIQVTASGSLGLCERGPNMVVYPDGVWYSGVQKADVPEIVREHFKNNRPVERLMNKDAAALKSEVLENKRKYLAALKAAQAGQKK